MNATQKHQIEVTGNGKNTIIFAHGFACDQSIWDQVAPAFEKDFKVVRFNHLAYESYAEFAKDLIAIVDELKLEGAYYVGHSASGMIGVLAALQRPGIFAKMIGIGPSPCYINDGDYHGGGDRSAIDGIIGAIANDYRGWAAFMAPIFMGNPDRPELGKQLTAIFQERNPEAMVKFAKAVFYSDHRKDIQKMKTPYLVLQCKDDPAAPASVCEFIEKNMPGSTRIEMKASGHYPQLSAPEETIRLIRAYLN